LTAALTTKAMDWPGERVTEAAETPLALMLPDEAVTVTVAEPASMTLTPKPAATDPPPEKPGSVSVVAPVVSKNVPQSVTATL